MDLGVTAKLRVERRKKKNNFFQYDKKKSPFHKDKIVLKMTN